MAKIIALFNHKGGVSKTTTTFNLGWALAERGKTVLLVDADPQCNLTGMALDLSGHADIAGFYASHPRSNLYSTVTPAFRGNPEALAAATPVATNHATLFLLAGHIDLASYEPDLAMAHRMAGAMALMQNLPGALGHLIRLTADSINADYVLVDMSPSVGTLNQNLFLQSDFFLVPTSPDYFCQLAIESISRVIPAWMQEAERLRAVQAEAVYKLPDTSPKFIGSLSQRYRPRSGRPALAFQTWIDAINERVTQHLAPALQALNMCVDPATFTAATGNEPFEIAQIADFNSLIAKSQEHSTPIFALSDAQLERTGVVLAQMQGNRNAFRGVFEKLARDVEALTT